MEADSFLGGGVDSAGVVGVGASDWGGAAAGVGAAAGTAGWGGAVVFGFVTIMTMNFLSSIPWSFKILASSNIRPERWVQNNM